MAYAIFSIDQTYNVGDVVVYEGISYAFLYPHAPGEWNSAQVIAISPSFSYTSGVQDFNTLPNYNLSSPLPPGKFRVNYFVNNDSIVIPGNFPNDNNAYLPGEVATIQNYPYTHFSEDGIWAYTFAGWSLNKGLADGVDYYFGYELTMLNMDVNLYAQWTKVSTILVDSSAALTLKEAYRNAIPKMIIPEYFLGTRIKKIGTNAFLNSSVNEIVIPANIEDVGVDAFAHWTGTTLRFIDNEVTTKYPRLRLANGCFNNTPNLVNIILPYRWRAVQEFPGKVFGAQPKSSVLHIYIRNTQEYMSELLNTGDVEGYLADVDNPSLNYTRVFHWGYND